MPWGLSRGISDVFSVLVLPFGGALCDTVRMLFGLSRVVTRSTLGVSGVVRYGFHLLFALAYTMGIIPWHQWVFLLF
jgi:hypothetical protein